MTRCNGPERSHGGQRPYHPFHGGSTMIATMGAEGRLVPRISHDRQTLRTSFALALSPTVFTSSLASFNVLSLAPGSEYSLQFSTPPRRSLTLNSFTYCPPRLATLGQTNPQDASQANHPRPHQPGRSYSSRSVSQSTRGVRRHLLTQRSPSKQQPQGDEARG